MKKLLLGLTITASILMANNVNDTNKSNKTTSTTQKTTQIKKHHSMVYNFNIEFKTGSTKLDPHYEAKIKKFAELLKKHPNYKATIIAYTDSIGSKKRNLLLSTKRAQDVYNELIKLGIDKNRLKFKGYGESHPIASNKTEKGREKNRRIIAIITK